MSERLTDQGQANLAAAAQALAALLQLLAVEQERKQQAGDKGATNDCKRVQVP